MTPAAGPAAPPATPPRSAGEAGPRLRALRRLCQQEALRVGSTEALLASVSEHFDREWQLHGWQVLSAAAVLANTATANDAAPQSLTVQVAAAALQEQAPRIGRRTGQEQAVVIAVPIWGAESPAGALTVAYHGDIRSVLLACEACEALAEAIAVQRQTEAIRHEAETAQAAAVAIDLVARMQSEPQAERAQQRLVDELAAHWPGATLILARRDHGRRTLLLTTAGIQPSLTKDPQCRRCVEAAAEETLLRQGLSCWPPLDLTDRTALIAHRQASRALGASAMASIPLKDPTAARQPPTTVLLVALHDQAAETTPVADVVPLLAALAGPLGATLRLWDRTRQPRMLQGLAALIAAVGRWQGRLMVLAVAACVSALLVPITYHLKCDCTVEPSLRRFIAAPFDSQIEEVLVRPGDFVHRDQVLARLEGRELRWQLGQVSADLNRVATERAGHLAERHPGEARLAELEMERLELRTQLLENRLQRLDVRSPVDGLVITGELDKSVGMPVETGQNLFEIAPLERLTIELQVPQEEIACLAVGQPVTVTFEAYPERDWRATLLRIYPRAERRQDAHVFLAEVEIDNEQRLLRPGMAGRGSIETEPHSLGWILFHRAWARTLLWLGW